jgi:uncharacterized protein DUF6188
MELKAENHSWRVAFNNGTVQQIKIDFRLGLLLTDGNDAAELCIGTPFRLINLGTTLSCIPENPESLAPVLALARKKVIEITIQNSGHMTIFFEFGSSLEVDPDDSYEAWEIGGSTGFLFVCRPGTGVTFFADERSKAQVPSPANYHRAGQDRTR